MLKYLKINTQKIFVVSRDLNNFLIKNIFNNKIPTYHCYSVKKLKITNHNWTNYIFAFTEADASDNFYYWPLISIAVFIMSALGTGECTTEQSGRRLRDVTLGLSPAEIRSAWVLYWQVERWPRGMPSDRRRGFIAPSGVVTALLLIIYLCWCPRFLFSWINFCAIVYVLI